MGKGIDMARADAPAHCQVLDDFKDQLLIVLIKRLADRQGHVRISVAEINDTGRDMLALRLFNGVFEFELRKKS
jgi:hypothetical protein